MMALIGAPARCRARGLERDDSALLGVLKAVHDCFQAQGLGLRRQTQPPLTGKECDFVAIVDLRVEIHLFLVTAVQRVPVLQEGCTVGGGL